MKILVVVDSIDVNGGSGPKANAALIENLSNAGFEVSVYHYTSKEIKSENHNIQYFSIPEKKWNLNYFLSRSERYFTKFTKISLNRFLENSFGFSFTFFNDVNSIKSALNKVSIHPDLIITLSQGGSFRPHAALLKLSKFHKKWLAYVHDPYPFHYNPRPYNWVQPGYLKKEKFIREISEKAQFSAFPSQLLREWMGSYFPAFLKNSVVIPHQLTKIDTENVTLPSFFNPKYFSLLHAGNLLKQRDPIDLIKAYQKFLTLNSEAQSNSQLLLLGPASYHQKSIMLQIKDCHNIIFVNENVPFLDVLALQNKVSCNIILESKSEISPFLPAKFPHCVHSNKTIIALGPYYSETKRLLGENYSYWSEINDIDHIIAIIEDLYQKWKFNPNELMLNRPDLEKYLSSDYLKEVIQSLYE